MPAVQFPTLKFAVVSLLVFLAGPRIYAATYYVSPGGNDSGPGSSDQPFRTVQRGVSQAAAGDTVLLGDGVYGNEGHISDGSGGMHGSAAAVTITTAGTADAWITLKAQNKGNAILDCGTTTTALGCDKYINLGVTAAYWSIQDLVVTHGAFGGIGSDSDPGGATNIRITGCDIGNIGYWNDTTTIGEEAIGFPASATNWWIEGNVIHDIGRIPVVNLDHGIYAEGTNITVINNVFYNMPRGWAIQLANGATNWLIANNTFAFPNQLSGGGHIMLWNANTNITIRDNIFSSPSSSQNYAIQRYTSSMNGCYVDHNMVYGASSLMSDTTGCSVSSNMMNVDPQFISTSFPYNFHLQPGSLAIGAGISVAEVATDLLGVLRAGGDDLGAYQFGSPASLQIVNTTSGNSTWAVGDGWTVTIAGGAPTAPVAVSIGGWTSILGQTDGSGNFTVSGSASPGNVGTSSELWTVGGASVNPNPVIVTVVPGLATGGVPGIGSVDAPTGTSIPNTN